MTPLLVGLLLAQPLNLNIQPPTTFRCDGGISCSVSGRTLYISGSGAAGDGYYDGGKVAEAYMADASITAQVAQTAYSADASYLAVQFAANPTDCAGGEYATAIAANGNLTCAPVSSSGKVAEAYMADASVTAQVASVAYSADAGYYATEFIANPSDCSANQYATTIASNGNLTCSQVAYSQVSGTPTLYNQTIQDEGGALTQRATLNFTGAGVSCVDNAGSSRTDCTIAGGGSGSRTVYASNGSDTPIAVATTDPGVSLISKTLTVAANDTVTIEVFADIMNNSGATKTYTLRCRAASTTLVAVSDSTTLAAGTTRGTYRFRCVYAVRSTTSTRVRADLYRTPTTAANTTQTVATRAAWNTSASNWTGSQTFALNISSSATGATQDAIVTAYEITHQASSP